MKNNDRHDMSSSFRYLGAVASAMITDELKDIDKHGKHPVSNSNDSCWGPCQFKNSEKILV